MALETYGLAGLFLGSFLAATILPFSSEALFLLLLYQNYDPVACLLVVIAGNCLGGSLNYGIGRLGNPRWLKRLGFKTSQLDKNQLRVEKYGAFLGFFSWVPVIGDPLLLVLGYFRSPAVRTLGWMILGKVLRYVVILWGWHLL
jgi:membrane protein YqaA with SNARE-associated domain